jgi:hypothetical protein
MDDLERDYLCQQIQTLTRSNRWWKALAVGLMGALVLFLILGMGSFVAFRLSVTQQQRVMDAQVEQARSAEMRFRQLKMEAARLEAEKRKAKANPSGAQSK